jgi:hypothetical protein
VLSYCKIVLRITFLYYGKSPKRVLPYYCVVSVRQYDCLTKCQGLDGLTQGL